MLADRGTSPSPEGVVRTNDLRNLLLDELTRAADGAGRIAIGAAQARHEVSSILENPVGRRALNRLMITDETIRDHPDLRRGLDAYITPDGHRSRIDLTQADRIYSAAAMDKVVALRRRTNEFLGDFQGMHVTARISGENAESADIRALIRSDQVQSWYVVPIGVFLVLLLTLRDPLPCLNLVATMVLTYAFALGATHLLFVTILGTPRDRLESPILPVRPLGGRRRRLQRVPDGPPPRGVAPHGTQGGDHPCGRPDGRADYLSRGDHRVQLRVILVQPALLAPTARLRARRRHHDRRADRPARARAMRPLADEAPRRVASAIDPRHGRAPAGRCPGTARA